jgi:O-antigen/teichoic acid export membrane protein
MTGYHKTELINLVGMSMCNIALNLWLIPQFGMIGAAIATSTSIAMVNVLKVLEVHYIIGVWPFSLEWWFLGPGAILTWVIARFVRSKEPNIIGAIIALLFVFGLILAIAFVVRSETDEQIINRIKR